MIQERSNPRRCFVAPCRLQNNEEETMFDRNGLIYRLLLFDKYYLHSARLEELSDLLRMFGLAGLYKLLDAKVLYIDLRRSLFTLPGNIALNPQPEQMNFHAFSFSSILPPEAILRQAVHDVFNKQGISLTERQFFMQALEKVVETQDSNSDDIIQQRIHYGLENMSPEVLEAIRLLLDIKQDQLHRIQEADIRFERLGGDTYRHSSQLRAIFNLSQRDEHTLVGKMLLALGHFEIKYHQMERLNAISAFENHGLALLNAKLGNLAAKTLTDNTDSTFASINYALDLPGVPDDEPCKVNAGRLLEIRENPGCRAFRDLLQQHCFDSEKDIQDLVGGLSDGIRKLDSGFGKKLVKTFLAIALGHISSPLGDLHTIFDAFYPHDLVADKCLYAFLKEDYPSIFGKHYMP